jgi:CHASE2 domain-containing sensor protein
VSDLGAEVIEYLRARTADHEDLSALRDRLLPSILQDASALRRGLESRAALCLVEDAGGPAEVLDTLRGRIDGGADRATVLLVDSLAGGARPAELVVHVEPAPGRGRVICAGRCDDDAAIAAENAVAAASAALRARGIAAEPGDLEVSWHVPGMATVEGPSLGLPLSLLLVRRAQGRPAPRGHAATGAISPRGEVLPVSGLEAKLAAARAAGLTTVLVPPDGPTAPPARAVATLEEALGGRHRRLIKLPLAAAVITALLIAIGAFDGLDAAGYAAVHAPRDTAGLSEEVALVTWNRSDVGAPTEGIDFSSFADHRSYRATHGAVIDRLVSAGVRSIALDAWIAGDATAGTDALAAAIARATEAGVPVVLPSRRGAVDHPWDPPHPRLVAAGVTPSFSTTRPEGRRRLVRSLRLAGSDPDGPRWGLAAQLVAAGADLSRPSADELLAGSVRVQAPSGLIWPHFPAEPAWTSVRYADVHAGRFEASTLLGTHVLIGSTQGLDDLHRTPVGRWYGVQIQAAAVNAMLLGKTLRPVDRRSRSAIGASAALLVLLFGSVGASLRRRSGLQQRAALLAVAGSVSLLAAGVSAAGVGVGVWWPWTDLAAPAVLLAAFWIVRPVRRSAA